MKARDVVFLKWWGQITVVLLIASSVLLLTQPADSQATDPVFVAQAIDSDDDDTASIVITGPVQVINLNIITIYDIDVAVAPTDPILAGLTVGTFLRVEGTVGDDSTGNVLIFADTVQPATPDDTAPILIVGAVQQINAFILTISNLNVVLSPDDPFLDDVQVGDVVQVDGIIPEDLYSSIDGVTIFVITIAYTDAAPTPQPMVTEEVAPTEEVIPTEEVTATQEVMLTEEPTVTEEVVDDDDDGSDEDGTGTIIVIEGPVQQINVNIITIYNINIILEQTDPVLTVIQIGDVIRVEGITDDAMDDDDDDGTVVGGISIIAINITFINVEVVIIDGFTWRDSGNCQNPPPQMIQAVGGGIEWLIRCAQPPPSVGGGGGDDDDDDNGGNRGGSRGNRGGGGDDDDDD